MEKRNPFLLMLSSDSDLWNSSSSFSSPPDCSFCFLFFLRFLLSFALLELNLEVSDELSESLPAALGSLECSEAVTAAACYIEETWFQHGSGEELTFKNIAQVFAKYLKKKIQLTPVNLTLKTLQISGNFFPFHLIKAFRNKLIFSVLTFITFL